MEESKRVREGEFKTRSRSRGEEPGLDSGRRSLDPERGRSFVGEGGSTESVIVREGSSGFSGDRGSPAKVVDRARYKKVVRRREPQTDSLPFCAINR